MRVMRRHFISADRKHLVLSFPRPEPKQAFDVMDVLSTNKGLIRNKGGANNVDKLSSFMQPILQTV